MSQYISLDGVGFENDRFMPKAKDLTCSQGRWTPNQERGVDMKNYIVLREGAMQSTQNWQRYKEEKDKEDLREAIKVLDIAIAEISAKEKNLDLPVGNSKNVIPLNRKDK